MDTEGSNLHHQMNPSVRGGVRRRICDLAPLRQSTSHNDSGQVVHTHTHTHTHTCATVTKQHNTEPVQRWLYVL